MAWTSLAGAKQLGAELLVDVRRSIGARVLHFIHIRKTGGSAIRKTIADQPGPFNSLCRTSQFLIAGHGHSFKLAHAADEDQVFFCVRDPLDRYVSGFYARYFEGRSKKYNPWSPEERLAFENFESPDELGLALTGNREDQELAVWALENIGHINSSYWYWFESEEFLRSRASQILAVLCQENLDQEYALFRDRHAPELHELPRDPSLSNRNRRTVDTTLSDEAVFNLKRWYRREYDFLTALHNLGLIEREYS